MLRFKKENSEVLNLNLIIFMMIILRRHHFRKLYIECYNLININNNENAKFKEIENWK